MIQHEVSIGKLYRVFSEKFPEYFSLWSRLAEEEAGHANWIRKFKEKIDAGTVYLKDNRFKVVAIGTSMKYIQGLIDKAKQGEMAAIKALSLALDLEKALIENEYFEFFETDSAELKAVLRDLE